MPTPIFVCGAECGIAVTGTLSGGTEHWGSVAGTPTVATSGPATMRSTRCFRFNPSAATSTLDHSYATVIASPATTVARFYVYFATLPSADCQLFWTGTAPGTTAVVFSQADSSIYASGANTTLRGATGVAVTTGQWYRVDVKAVTGTTRTCDVSVNGVACGQYSLAGQTALSSSAFGIGVGAAATADLYIDDVIVSGTSADFPIGAGTVAGLYPNGDGTHSFVATGNFLKAGTANTSVAVTDTDVWASLTNPLSTAIDTTKFVSDAVATNTSYVEFVFGDLPAVASVNGLMVVMTSHSGSATANAQRMQLNDNGTISYVLGTAVPAYGDLSETTIADHVATFATAPSTAAAWSKLLVDGLKIRWGLSNDVTPNPFLDGVCLEVDYVAVVIVAIPNRITAVNQAVARAAVR